MIYAMKRRTSRNPSCSSHDNLKKMKTTTTMYEKRKRTRSNHSPSTSGSFLSNQRESVRHVSNMITSSGGKLWGAKKRRTPVSKRLTFEAKDCNKDSNSTDRSTRGDSNIVGGKADECLKENSLHYSAVSEDCIRPSEVANVRAEYNSATHDRTSRILERVQSDSNENLIKKCVGNDKGGNLTTKRKGIVVDKCSDVTSTLVDDDCCNVVETNESSKRIRRTRTTNVDQSTSKSNDEKSCVRDMEDSSRTQGNNVEAEKIRNQQKSLHLSLKPEIEKLCEILLLPDNVKSMAGKILEYIMNNHRICAEPISVLQAFQLSLCLTSASLLKYKLDTEASLILAKKHLNFVCKKYAVDKMLAMLWDLRETFLLVKENSTVAGSPKAFESSNKVHSNTYIIPYVELAEKNISRNIDESQKRKNQWRKLRQMQLENKHNLKKDIETKEADFAKRYKIELAAYKKYYAMTEEKLKDYNHEYYKRLAELKRQHEVRLYALETKNLEARQKLRQSWTLDEVLETSPEFLANTVKSPDYLEYAKSLNSSSTDKFFGAGLDTGVSSRPCSSSSHEEAACKLKDNVVVSESTTSDHQELVHKTTLENTFSPATSVSIPANLIEPEEQVQVQPLSSVQSPPSPVVILPANQSNPVSMIMEPIEQIQQLPSSTRFLPSYQDFTREDALSSRIRVASTGFQNQASEQHAPNLEVGSRTHQLVPPISNMVFDSHVPGVVRAQLSNTGNFSTQRVINNHPIQNAEHLTSTNGPPLCNNSYLNKLERMRKLVDEQNLKNREQMELQLKYNFEKEIEERRRKYDIQLKKLEAQFHEASEKVVAGYKTAYLNTIVTEAMNAKSNAVFPGASQTLQDIGYNHLLHQLPRQKNATCPLQASYTTLENFRDFSARLPPVKSVSSASRNLQAGVVASDLPPYGPSTFKPTSSISQISHGMPRHVAKPSRINSNSLPYANLQAGGEICTPALHIKSCRCRTPYGVPSRPAEPSNTIENYVKNMTRSMR